MNRTTSWRGLPFPLFVTASLHSFLSEALRRVPGKEPQGTVLGLADPTGATPVGAELSAERPLVYHLFGRLNDLRSSVITEDNYFDFLIHFWKEREGVPKVVRAALTNTSLLFLGFRMHHWDFRVLFAASSRRRAPGGAPGTRTWPCRSTPTTTRSKIGSERATTWKTTSGKPRTRRSTSTGARRRMFLL